MLESVRLRAPDEPFGGPFVRANRALPLATDPPPPSAQAKRLADLSAAVPLSVVLGDTDVVVLDLTYRSSEVRPGALFFCVPGARVDGHRFAAQACAAGAAGVLVERRLDTSCSQVLVPSVRLAMGPVSAAFFGRPAERLMLVGVTGTNGKTTTTYLLESIFRSAGMAAGIIGTTGVRVAGRVVPFDHTTPEAPDLQRLLSHMLEEGIQAVAMEVSSHGLDQHRVDGSHYACSVFTNFSQDHLDYHGTLDAYFEAKARLFTPELSGRAVVNGDSPEGRALSDRARIPTVRFGMGGEPGNDVVAHEVALTPDGLTFAVDGLQIRSQLRGLYNAYNCLGAVAAAREVGIEDRAIADGIANLTGVPGRLEPVDAGQPFPILVDYAHTPDSLENVLRVARELARHRLILVFGCGGDRDRGKRPVMGEVATGIADLTVITSDNPRSEDPQAITAEIERGARRGRGSYLVEPDRRAAIRLALQNAGEGDVVVIAGKGHETDQQFRDRTVPFDDRVVAAQELRRIVTEDER